MLPLRAMQKSKNASSTGAPDKMIVVARADEDVSFLSLYFPDVPHTVYQVNLQGACGRRLACLCSCLQTLQHERCVLTRHTL